MKKYDIHTQTHTHIHSLQNIYSHLNVTKNGSLYICAYKYEKVRYSEDLHMNTFSEYLTFSYFPMFGFISISYIYIYIEECILGSKLLLWQVLLKMMEYCLFIIFNFLSLLVIFLVLGSR